MTKREKLLLSYFIPLLEFIVIMSCIFTFFVGLVDISMNLFENSTVWAMNTKWAAIDSAMMMCSGYCYWTLRKNI